MVAASGQILASWSKGNKVWLPRRVVQYEQLGWRSDQICWAASMLPAPLHHTTCKLAWCILSATDTGHSRPDALCTVQARGNEVIQLHQEAAAIAPRLASAVQAVQDWQARHADCAQQLRTAQQGRADLTAELDRQTAEVQQLGHLLGVKQKEIDRVSCLPGVVCQVLS